jgi:HEAT repeat protein
VQAEPLSESLFERWAVECPEKLLAAVLSNLTPPALLTYAAEIAGKALPSEQIVPALLGLLQHASPIVREGAVYGLSYHSGDAAMQALQALAECDPIIGVQCAARAAIEDSCRGVEEGW